MRQILHIADTLAGAVPYRSYALAQDSWLALNSVATLIQRLQPDVVVHAGGILGSGNARDVQRFRDWVEGVSWNGGPQFVFACGELEGPVARDACCDFDVVTEGGDCIGVAGLRFCHVHDVEAYLQTGHEPLIAAGAGVIAGSYGSRPETLPASVLTSTARYTALSGVPRPQLMSPTVAYSGPVNPVALTDVHGAWVSLVTLSESKVDAIYRYKLPTRPRAAMRIDATAQDTDIGAIVDRLRNELRTVIESASTKTPPQYQGGPLVWAELVVIGSEQSTNMVLRQAVKEVEHEALSYGASYVEVAIRVVGQF